VGTDARVAWQLTAIGEDWSHDTATQQPACVSLAGWKQGDEQQQGEKSPKGLLIDVHTHTDTHIHTQTDTDTDTDTHTHTHTHTYIHKQTQTQTQTHTQTHTHTYIHKQTQLLLLGKATGASVSGTRQPLQAHTPHAQAVPNSSASITVYVNAAKASGPGLLRPLLSLPVASVGACKACGGLASWSPMSITTALQAESVFEANALASFSSSVSSPRAARVPDATAAAVTSEANLSAAEIGPIRSAHETSPRGRPIVGCGTFGVRGVSLYAGGPDISAVADITGGGSVE
jgi:hypothetical protein